MSIKYATGFVEIKIREKRMTTLRRLLVRHEFWGWISVASFAVAVWAFNRIVRPPMPWSIVVSVLCGVVIGYVAVQVVRLARRVYVDDVYAPMTAAGYERYVKDNEAKFHKRNEFCTSCGSRAIMFVRQQGFLVSGVPWRARAIACPDWDGEVGPMPSTIPILRSSFNPTSEPTVYPCQNVMITPWEPADRHNHDESQVALDCFRCIVKMESMGVMEREAAQARIDEIEKAKVAALAGEVDKAADRLLETLK